MIKFSHWSYWQFWPSNFFIVSTWLPSLMPSLDMPIHIFVSKWRKKTWAMQHVKKKRRENSWLEVKHIYTQQNLFLEVKLRVDNIICFYGHIVQEKKTCWIRIAILDSIWCKTCDFLIGIFVMMLRFEEGLSSFSPLIFFL